MWGEAARQHPRASVRAAALAIGACALALLIPASTAIAAAGDLDPGFGTGGKVTTGISPASTDDASAVAVPSDGAKAVAIQANGAIVVGGVSGGQSSPGDFALVRYTSAGALDTTFDSADADGNGADKVTTDFGATREDDIRGIAILTADQAIVV